MLKSLEIRQRLLPEDHFELANSYNNYGNTVLQGFRSFLCKSQAEKDEIMYIPMFSGSRSYRMLGEFAEAMELAQGAREYILNKFGSGGSFDGL
jgi:hypothetical protein